ncbi:MAG TPA: SgcJ/EcaC family oxidoreductase [Woeseiaceae bacterium]|nr:SgcJ/EcaC family oxidoreductase [Woeseiaceae bacterium]
MTRHKRHGAIRIPALLLALFVGSPVGLLAGEDIQFEGNQADIDAILGVFNDWTAARNAGDVDAVASMYHEDMQIMTRNRALLSGRQGARTFYAENYSSGSERELYGKMLELRVFDDVAFVTGLFLVVDEDDGIEDPGYYLNVLRRNDQGRWLIYRDIDTPSPDGLRLKDAD